MPTSVGIIDGKVMPPQVRVAVPVVVFVRDGVDVRDAVNVRDGVNVCDGVNVREAVIDDVRVMLIVAVLEGRAVAVRVLLAVAVWVDCATSPTHPPTCFCPLGHTASPQNVLVTFAPRSNASLKLVPPTCALLRFAFVKSLLLKFATRSCAFTNDEFVRLVEKK